MPWELPERVWGSDYRLDTHNKNEVSRHDLVNDYFFNSLGFRSDEFSSQELLVAGCSMTFGEGVPYEYTWGSELARQLGVSVANLGVRGTSIISTVYRVIAYLKTYEAPKYVVCLFPNSERLEVAYSKDSIGKYTFNYLSDKQVSFDISTPTHIRPRGVALEPYAKKPYEIDALHPVEEVLDLINMDYIKMLEYICELRGITFRWGFWQAELQQLYEQSNTSNSSNYVSVGEQINKLIYEDFKGLNGCHEDLKATYREMFFEGADTAYGTDGSHRHQHWGIHGHVHAAELFKDSLNKVE